MRLKGFKKCALTFLLSGFMLISSSISAYADTGIGFSATIKTGNSGYGIVNGKDSGKYYHLTPGRVGLEVKNVSGGTFEVYLYKGSKEIDRCVNITSATWRRFFDIPKDSSDYWLKVAVTGKTNTTYSISGKIHDHGDPH
ncbi:hypothetical protein [Clostridium sp.]|uniref:hypothetical protein n=1 Tax=Clostridium sp. TaxID=1506 RepID=UPI002FC74295